MKILVIKFRNIGDVLLLTPLLENLRLHFTKATIDVACNQESVMMLEGNPYIDTIIPYQRAHIKALKGFQRLQEEWRYFSIFKQQHYDWVINTTEGDRGAFIAFLTGAKRVFSPASTSLFAYKITDLIPPYKGHIVESHLDVISLMQKEIKSKRVSLFYDDDCLKKIQELGARGDYIHFHPLSRWLFKCIDDTLSAKIIDFCQTELNMPVILTSAPTQAEMSRIDSILSHCHTKPLNLSGQTTLKECAALSDHARAFIGVDTANMHIAAAMDTPVLAFFVASAVFHWGAWDNQVSSCPYGYQDGIQSMGKHTIFVKNSARSDKEIMHNYKTHGTFDTHNFDFELFAQKLREAITLMKAR